MASVFCRLRAGDNTRAVVGRRTVENGGNVGNRREFTGRGPRGMRRRKRVRVALHTAQKGIRQCVRKCTQVETRCVRAATELDNVRKRDAKVCSKTLRKPCEWRSMCGVRYGRCACAAWRRQRATLWRMAIDRYGDARPPPSHADRRQRYSSYPRRSAADVDYGMLIFFRHTRC